MDKCSCGNHENKCDNRLGERINHLIVYCHPNPQSLCNAYKTEVIRLTEESCNNVNVRSLYNIGFQPVLGAEDFKALSQGQVPEDIKIEQDYIQWANLITFIYPVWWAGFPALLKGYIDRVFSSGFAYRAKATGEIEPLLKDKQVILLSNMGTPFELCQASGMLHSMHQTVDQGIFEFCGMEVITHRFFGHIPMASDEERRGHIKLLKLIYDKVLPKY